MNEIDNIAHCECGCDFSEVDMKNHEISNKHQRYVNLKKAYKDALGKPVQIGIAS